MKPEISTAVMIERLRALIPDSQDGALLNQVANRIELLLEAESGMSREMACIRHALDIPPDQSVQSGVVDAFVRLNSEVLELRSRLEAYDRAAKEPVYQYQSGICNDENGETDWYWDDCDKGFYDQYAADRRRILYAAPPLPVVPYAYAYQYAGCETCEGFKNWSSELSKERPADWMLETGKVTDLIELYAVNPLSVAPVPDGYVLVSNDLLDEFPEINICNYNHDDVRKLNSWGVEVVSSTNPQPISKGGDA
ncbi:hypothetical protein SOV92_21620 [Pectobacterium brasiliense]|uniref:Uncharacterized protein n=1 Tax=Pectobacterium brasiliense TaxID=180957 RepID=A0AAW9HKY8_9GAMM|nr:hypothetical protein [Pectobacterium brasiliense]MDY4380370.1 hypothetical protein [Pectobacterium brasiliense]